MAGLKLAAVTAAIATGTAAKTLAQIIAPANHRVQLKRLEISFDGVTNTATPIKVDILRQTTAGTMSSPAQEPAPKAPAVVVAPTAVKRAVKKGGGC